jgi:hypothetical protein
MNLGVKGLGAREEEWNAQGNQVNVKGPREIEFPTHRYAIKALDKNHADFDLPSLEKEVMILKKVHTPPRPPSKPCIQPLIVILPTSTPPSPSPPLHPIPYV